MWDLSFLTRDWAHILSIRSMEFQPLDHQGASFFSRVWLFATPWTVARQASLSVEFSRQEYWNGFPFPFAGDLPHPGIKPQCHCFGGRFFIIWASREAREVLNMIFPCLYSRFSGTGENPKRFFKWYQGEDSLNLIYWLLWSCLSSISYISLGQRIPSCILYLWKLPVIWLPAFPHSSKEYILLFRIWLCQRNGKALPNITYDWKWSMLADLFSSMEKWYPMKWLPGSFSCSEKGPQYKRKPR